MSEKELFEKYKALTKPVPFSQRNRVVEFPNDVKEAYLDYQEDLRRNKITSSSLSFEGWLQMLVNLRNYQVDEMSKRKQHICFN